MCKLQIMGSKKWLIGGIILLVFGIFIKKLTDFGQWGIFMILLGVSLKTMYIVAKVRSGEYKPGAEFFYLIAGLCMFIAGLILKSNKPGLLAYGMIIVGLALKIGFIVLFIRSVKRNKSIHPTRTKSGKTT